MLDYLFENDGPYTKFRDILVSFLIGQLDADQMRTEIQLMFESIDEDMNAPREAVVDDIEAFKIARDTA